MRDIREQKRKDKDHYEERWSVFVCTYTHRDRHTCAHKQTSRQKVRNINKNRKKETKISERPER